MPTVLQKMEANSALIWCGLSINIVIVITSLTFYIRSFCLTDLCYSREAYANESFQEYMHARLFYNDIVDMFYKEKWLIFKDVCSKGSIMGLCQPHQEYERMDFTITGRLFLVVGFLIYFSIICLRVYTTTEENINQATLRREIQERQDRWYNARESLKYLLVTMQIKVFKKKYLELQAENEKLKEIERKMLEPTQYKITTTVHNRKKEKGTYCTICFEEFHKNNRLGTLKCKCSDHVKYHYACISKWLHLKRNYYIYTLLTCPLCTNEI